MSIFQFVWQIIALCGLFVAVMYGLFSAPWYVLGGFLLIALGFTWKLMPSQEKWVSEPTQSVPAPRATQPGTDAANPTDKPAMFYRGAPYNPGTATPDAPARPTVLSYRGCAYENHGQAATPTDQAVEAEGVPRQ